MDSVNLLLSGVSLTIKHTGCLVDDRTGYLVGDSIISGTHEAGEILKTIIPVNIQGASAGQVSWTEKPVEDGITAHSIVTSPTQINYNAIAFNSPYAGFVGGSYTSPSTTGYPYARLLSDQGGMFSALLWYDREGRVIISQNTKQKNNKRIAYSYTLYDALGRIVETGEKIENTDTAKLFNKIFGDTIIEFYNPNVISRAKYIAWIKDSSGPRVEVTHFYYDVQEILPTKVLVQQEIRDRPVTVTYSDTLNVDSTKYNTAIHYSYDILGNRSTIIQDDTVADVDGQRYKRIDYHFDIVSGNVNEMEYQEGQPDRFYQKYNTDVDNRIVSVCTSKDSIIWDNDANYFYYANTQLARVELGDQQLQGVDYSFTLQDGLKAVNSDLLDSNRDMGHDGLQISGNLNRYFARDAFGYTLKYFKGALSTGQYGDYDAIDKTKWNDNVSRFEAKDYNSDLMSTRHDLYNGNISAMVTNIQKPQEYSASSTTQKPVSLPQGTAYNYDQLNRLIDMKAYQNLDTNNVWGNAGTYDGLYHNWLTYDANGNILTQKRADSVGEVFDSLTYHYNIQGGRTLQNRLYQVNDAVNISGIHNDIKDEGSFINSSEHDITQRNNYRYNALGELAKDSIAGLDTIIWTDFYKIWKIKKHDGDSIIFVYDPIGNRVMKEFKPASGNPVNTFYIRDEAGDIIAIYTKQIIGSSLSYSLSERDIYGMDKLGIERTPLQLIGAIPISQIDTFSRYLGFKQYELQNFSDNVIVTISDRKIPRPDVSLTYIDHYEADVLSSTDYYPFGMIEPGRNFNSSVYKYGFNNKIKDDEIYGNNNEYDLGNRIYDPRLGRFLTVDPLASYEYNKSNYSYSGNSPISSLDVDGAYQMSAEDQKKYPMVRSLMIILSNYVNRAEASVNDPLIHQFILQAGLTGTDADNIETVRQILSYGSGPYIRFANNLGDNGKNNASGATTDELANPIYFSKKMAIQLQTLKRTGGKKMNSYESTANLFVAFITLWHEGIHYADLIDGVIQDQPAGQPDIGDIAEKNLFGLDIGDVPALAEYFKDVQNNAKASNTIPNFHFAAPFDNAGTAQDIKNWFVNHMTAIVFGPAGHNYVNRTGEGGNPILKKHGNVHAKKASPSPKKTQTSHQNTRFL